MYQTSRYTFQLRAGDQTILFNTRTGRALLLGGSDAEALAGELCRLTAGIDIERVTTHVFDALRAGGFVIDAAVDELAFIRARYLVARDQTPAVLTVTTTMDCNLGCYYCYESRSSQQLTVLDVDRLVVFARERLLDGERAALHVDWYGGEPLLNVRFIERASAALQDLCAEMKVGYSASIISNGTVWPADVEGFIVRNRIRQVQISFDGLKESHNKRRHYRSSHRPDAEATTFDVTWALIGRLLDHVRVDIRINLDAGNHHEIQTFLETAREAGWFQRRHLAVIQPARLSAYSAKSTYMRETELTPEQFDTVRASVRQRFGKEITIEESEAPEHLPEPKSSVCAALASHSAVVGADGFIYRCGLQVGETHRAVGCLQDHSLGAAPKQTWADDIFWREFDPTQLPQCAHCSFLPVCWGGCPKRHLEQDAKAIAEQGFYWRQNLPRLIANAVGISPEGHRPFREDEQFRDAAFFTLHE